MRFWKNEKPMPRVLVYPVLMCALTAQAYLPGVRAKVIAQPQEKKKSIPTPAESELKKHNREIQLTRIFALLRETAESARGWTDAAAASKAQTQIADLVWDFDTEAARAYLVRAWETAGKVEDPQKDRSRFRNQSLKTEAKREVMLVARKRAPELAERWLKEMAQEESERNSSNRGVFDDRTGRSTVLLQMAMQIVTDDPKTAAELTIDSLVDGVSFGFQEVLIRLQENNVELAQRVFRSALSRLRTAGMVDPNELLILYAYLYTPGRVRGANTSENRGTAEVAVGRNVPQIIAMAQVNPALAAEFLLLASNLLNSAPLPSATDNPTMTARSQLSVIGTIMSRLSEKHPEAAAALQARAQQITADAAFSTAPRPAQPDSPVPTPGESNKDHNSRRVDALEEIAQNERGSLRRDIAFATAALATTAETYQRGWELAGRVDDLTLRDNLRNWLTYRAALHCVKGGNLDRAYELSSKDSDATQRAAILIVGAQTLLKQKDNVRAGQWLLDARTSLKKANPDDSSVHVAFGLVSTYARFDNLMAFDALTEAVRLMSKSDLSPRDDDRAPLAMKFGGLPIPPDFTYGTAGFSLRAAIHAFEVTEFEDVLAAIRKIASPELRGQANIMLCGKYLTSTKPAD
jgi:hypothetical protein